MKSTSTPINKRLASMRRRAVILLTALYLNPFGPLALVASVSFFLQVELLNTSAGPGAPTPQSSLVLLLADTARNGFAALQAGTGLTLGSLLGGGDKVLFRANLSALGTNGVLQTSTPSLDLDFTGSDSIPGSWSVGDPLAIVWFPNLSLSSGLLVGGESYGRLTMGTSAFVVGAGSEAFETPANEKPDHRLSYISNEVGANNLFGVRGSGSPTAADLVVVPEPSVPLLLMVAGCILYCSRRPSNRFRAQQR